MAPQRGTQPVVIQPDSDGRQLLLDLATSFKRIPVDLRFRFKDPGNPVLCLFRILHDSSITPFALRCCTGTLPRDCRTATSAWGACPIPLNPERNMSALNGQRFPEIAAISYGSVHFRIGSVPRGTTSEHAFQASLGAPVRVCPDACAEANERTLTLPHQAPPNRIPGPEFRDFRDQFGVGSGPRRGGGV